jgi:hypothetical protein
METKHVVLVYKFNKDMLRMKQAYEVLALNCCLSHAVPRLTIWKCLSLVISFWNKCPNLYFFKRPQPSVEDWLRAARVTMTISDIPNILNYRAIFYGCVCVCVCVYIYIYIYIHTHMHTYIHTYTHTHTHTIYIRGSRKHNNLTSRMRLAGRGLEAFVLKRVI